MIIDARHFDAHGPIECDICIVGAGPAGITLALELADSALRICLLESGGFDYERHAQSLLEGESAGAGYAELRDTRLAALGGSSAVWAGWCRALDPIDFEARSWVPDSGWPFPLEELLPFYRRAHEWCGLGPFEYDVSTWEARTGLTTLPVHGPNVEAAMVHQRPLKFGVEYRGNLEMSRSIRTLLHATALRLAVTPGSQRIESVQAATLNGRRFEVTASRFVLAAGGIENARLLLLSGESAERSVGNAHGLVGRYFMEHGFVNAGTFTATDHSRDNAFHFPCAERGARRKWSVRSVFTLDERALRGMRLLNCALFFHPQYEAHDVFDSAAVQALLEIGNKLRGRAVPGNYRRRVARVLQSPGKVLTAVGRKAFANFTRDNQWRTRAIFECAPDRNNRVTLGSSRDPFGRPLARLEWNPGDLDIASVTQAHGLFDAAMHAAGSGRFESRFSGDVAQWRAAIEGGKHHMGTTRMHSEPQHGVTDPDGKVHGVANLYVAGSSLFPTGGYANPTLTLVALAVRLARHLAGNKNG